MPYGGVKESGTGREGIKYAIEEMTEMKLVCIKNKIEKLNLTKTSRKCLRFHTRFYVASNYLIKCNFYFISCLKIVSST